MVGGAKHGSPGGCFLDVLVSVVVQTDIFSNPCKSRGILCWIVLYVYANCALVLKNCSANWLAAYDMALHSAGWRFAHSILEMRSLKS